MLNKNNLYLITDYPSIILVDCGEQS